MAYRSTSNGMVEQLNKSICEIIRRLPFDHPRQLDDFLDPALFAIRTAHKASTNETPAYLLMGMDSRTPGHPVGIGDDTEKSYERYRSDLVTKYIMPERLLLISARATENLNLRKNKG